MMYALSTLPQPQPHEYRDRKLSIGRNINHSEFTTGYFTWRYLGSGDVHPHRLRVTAL